MVEPAENIGIIFFAVAIIFMVICAGAASLPPARDFRVFLGAVILAFSWIIMRVAQQYFGAWDITSSFFFLDILYLIAFYLLSRPTKLSAPNATKNNNWAGYIVAIYAIMIANAVVHFLLVQDFFSKPIFIATLGLMGLIVLWGFIRGFGWLPTLAYLSSLAVIITLALFYYVETSNILTLAIFSIVIAQGFHGAKNNFAHWTKSSFSKDRSEKDKLDKKFSLS